MTLWSRELARREKARTYFRESTETDRHRVQEECGGGDWVSCPSHWMQWLFILEPGSEQVTPWESHHTLRYGEGKSVMSHPKDAAPTLNPKTCPPQNGAMAQRSKVSFSLSKQQHAGENKKIVSCDSPEFNSPVSHCSNDKSPTKFQVLWSPADLTCIYFTGPLSGDSPSILVLEPRSPS